MTLRLVGVGARHPDRSAQWLFRDLELEARPGRVVAVVGRNGAGKTTLLRHCAGLHPPCAGHVRLDDKELGSLDRRTRARGIAWLPQSTPLVLDIAVRDLVMLGRTPFLAPFSRAGAADHDAVRAALEQACAAHLAERRVFSLSSGEYQRVLVARMLATTAPILVLDEPTTALDIGGALDTLQLLRDLAGAGRVVLAALHDLDLARRFADDAICLMGDGTGRACVGAAAATLAPAILAEAFGVAVEHGEALVFRAREGGAGA